MPTAGMCFWCFQRSVGEPEPDWTPQGLAQRRKGVSYEPRRSISETKVITIPSLSRSLANVQGPGGGSLSIHQRATPPKPPLGVLDVLQSPFPHQPQNRRPINSLSGQLRQPHHQSQPVKKFLFLPPLLSPLRSPHHVCLLLSSNSFKLIFLQILFRSNRSDQNPFYQQRVRPGPQATIYTPRLIFLFPPEDSNGYPRG